MSHSSTHMSASVQTQAGTATRLAGLDLARALAIFGMVIVNFKLAMGAASGSALLLGFASLFEGRASALFVVLAGVGISLLLNKARMGTASEQITQARTELVKRGVLLMLLGLAFTPVWEADILHFYGCYFLLAAMLITASSRVLLFGAAVICLSFSFLMQVVDYDNGWDWPSLSYLDLWTVPGLVRHMLFNGFHPVIPWLAFLLLGIWLGRQDLHSQQVRNRILWVALSVWLTTELGCSLLRHHLLAARIPGVTQSDIEFLFSTAMMPPLPQYMIAAASLALVIIMTCLTLSERFASTKLMNLLCVTGQYSLTLYVSHVIVGMGLLELLGLLGNQPIELALAAALIFCVGGGVFSLSWSQYFRLGPLEWGFRELLRLWGKEGPTRILG